MNSDPKVNILLVDDQRSKLLSYEAILGSLDENLVLASSGKEALEKLLKQEFAVILVDVCMPEQDGFELVEMIRAHHRFKKTAIIFVSAIQMTDMDRLKGYASGAVDYVSVPIVPELLRAKVGVFVDLFRKTRQLETLNAELEERVLERTARLSETEEALREANQRKDTFLATLAHELRNPLAPIRSSLDLLNLVLTADPVTANATRIMDRQLLQMTRLIDDLMDLSRINQGKLELRKSVVNTKSVFQGAIETALPAIKAAEQTLLISQPEEEVSIEVDPARVSQVISNLLLNASKYTEVGGTIRFQAASDSSDLIIKVSDEGVGISAPEIPRVFEPFYQANSVRGGSNTGLGIGLTLVRTVVEMHGGEITVASDGKDKGAEFVVRLPRAVLSTSPAKPAPTGPKVATQPENRIKILVVDDNVDAAVVLSILLRRNGYEVELAHDGREAVELVSTFGPDLVLMDLGMPGLDGFAAAREIRNQESGRAVVLVAMTGWGQAEDRKKSKEAGFDHHFVKPVPMDELKELLAKVKPSKISVGKIDSQLG